MNANDPNVAEVELIAQALGELRDQLVFVGGCAVGLLLTDPAAAAPRVTYDVDLIAEVAALRAYHRLEREFSRRGFERDMAADSPICRWRYQRLEVDLMPTDPGVLGFANRWYPLAVTRAETTCSAATMPKTSSTSSTADPNWPTRSRTPRRNCGPI